MKERKIKSNTSIVVVSLVAIAVMVLVALAGDNSTSITGNAVAEPCFQSDLSLDYYAKGYAEFRDKKWEDICSSDGVRLQQAYCKTSVKVSMTQSYQCPYGCVNGACIGLESNCGNGVIDYGEQCDDGNNKNGDGCTAACVKEAGF